MIYFEDAVTTAYELSCLFEMAQAQAETGRLRLVPNNYSYQSDLNRVINRVSQGQFSDNSGQTTTQEKFLRFLLSEKHSFQIKETSLRLAVATFEKQSQIFMLAANNQGYSKSRLNTDISSPEKIIELANKHATVLATQLQKAENTLTQEEPLFGEKQKETPPNQAGAQALQQMKEKREKEKILAQEMENKMIFEAQREAMLRALAMNKTTKYPKP